jgi:hypothetical protein
MGKLNVILLYIYGVNRMQTEHKTKLTSAEMAELWSAYMNDSMMVCMLKYFLNKAVDTEIRAVIKYGLQLSQSHVERITKLFQAEKFPIPRAFGEEDVDISAPRLYSDNLMLTFIKQIGQLGINAYSVAIGLSARKDVYSYFSQCFAEMNKLHEMATDVLLSKGLYIRPPYIPTPDKVEFVNKQTFLAGWFADRRPLTVIEISHLYANIQRNAMGIPTLIGFSQTAQLKEVGQYMVRGKEIASKHVEVFTSILREDDIPAPTTWDGDVMESTTQVFSDKLTMFQVTALNALGIGYYGTSMGVSPRRDIGVQYQRLMAEVALYAEDGANIMIKNGWMERPPQAPDRDKLANK